MESIKHALSGLTMGRAAEHRNLTVTPLFLEEPRAGDTGYQLLEDALAKGLASVTEVSENGVVGTLRFTNRADAAVFLMDGEELVGAKQNRTVNLSVLAPPNQTITLPVSCVEQGRWHHDSMDFQTTDRVHYAGGRAAKAAQVSYSLLNYESREADQGEVWIDLALKAQRMSAESPSMAMAEVFERHAYSVQEFVDALSPVEGQAGALFAIDGSPIGLDLFDSPATLASLFPKLVRSYALDAIDASGSTVSRISAEEFLLRLRAATIQSYPAVGLGTDARLEGNGIAAGALTWDGRLVHLGAFVTNDASGHSDTSIIRASARRQHRA